MSRLFVDNFFEVAVSKRQRRYQRCVCVQERRSSLKQASLIGYTTCPTVESRPPLTAHVKYSTLHNARGNGDLVTSAAICYNSHVQLVPAHTTYNSNPNSNAKRTANCKLKSKPDCANTSCRHVSSPQSVGVSSGKRRRASSLCIKYRRGQGSDDDQAQTTCAENVSTCTEKVSTADICNCSPSFGARQPRIAASRRHLDLLDTTGTCSCRPATSCDTTVEACKLTSRTMHRLAGNVTVASSQV